jgi:hypothetical protein
VLPQAGGGLTLDPRSADPVSPPVRRAGWGGVGWGGGGRGVERICQDRAICTTCHRESAGGEEIMGSPASLSHSPPAETLPLISKISILTQRPWQRVAPQSPRLRDKFDQLTSWQGAGYEEWRWQPRVFRIILKDSLGVQPLVLWTHPGEGLLRLGSGSQRKMWVKFASEGGGEV